MKFADATKREKMTKSIKLELKPVPSTIKTIEHYGLNKLDELLKEEMDEYKPYIDMAVVSILNQSLDNAKIDFSTLISLENELKSTSIDFETKRELVKKIDAEKTNIKKCVVKEIEKNMPKPLRSIKDITSAKFLKEYMPVAVKSLDISSKEKARVGVLSENLASFTSATGKFLITRATALGTWAPSRVIENLDIYLSNINAFKTFVESDDAKDFVKENPEILSMITEEYYSCILSQNAIDGYNKIISGECNENGIVTKGYNQYVNELNQTHAATKEYKGVYYKKAKQLYKQILVPQEKQFTIEKVKSDDELRKLITELQESITSESILDICRFLRDSKKSDICISGKTLHVFSHISCGEHSIISKKIEDIKENELLEEKKHLKKKSELKKIDSLIDNISSVVREGFYSVADLELIMDDNRLYKRFLNKLFEQFDIVINNANKLEEEHIFDKRKLFGSDISKKLIKNYFDALITFRQYISLFKCDNHSGSSSNFYNEYDEQLSVLDSLTKAYNLTRNYLTASPKDFSEENPVCFGLSSKANRSWWKSSDAKLMGNKAAIVRKENKYYFVETNPLKRPTVVKQVENSNISFMSYTTLQNPMMMFPKRTFTENVKEAFKDTTIMEVPYEYGNELMITRELFEIKEKNLFTVGAVKSGLITEDGMKSALAKMIDFYKKICIVDPMLNRFTFNFKETDKYNDIGLFFDDAKVCTTKAEWICVDEKIFNDAVNDGSLLCFLITNLHMYKDGLSKTSYANTFLYMMSNENMKELNFRLNSAPSVTFRKASMPFKITHKKGSILLDKRNINGEFLRADVYKELYNYVNGNKDENNLSADALIQKELIKTKVCKYDIQKFKRYQDDKYFISMSYTINYKLPSRSKNPINEEVAELIDGKYKTLTVVRGTTDMLYYCLYGENKKLIKKESLNILNGIDYSEKLRSMSFERKNEMSENWNYDLKVKDIRNSYLNFAIAKIIDIAVENNAVIVIERFNEQFKNKMQAIDNQVFKTFETKLESRLLDYRKNMVNGESATISTPLQLVQNYSFSGTPLQNGILFRIDASYTNNMCPETGFVNLFDLTSIKTNAKKREFLSKFKEIKLCGDKIYYSFDYSDFSLKSKLDVNALDKTSWTIVVGKPKTVYDKENKIYTYVKQPVREVYDILGGEQIFYIETASDVQIKALYQLLEDTLKRTTVKQCKDVKKEYYSSPVTTEDTMMPIVELKASNLANKFWYYMSLEKGEFTLERWLNMSQS